ncbi:MULTISPECIES: hypothetical protein [unclassified Caballeronia]|uniref:hypothetical protein n=1 Tax=unclassified Caballeronia TaxID=2646786 RepID=UPI001F43CF17|nr:MULTISPECIES: hypothetical protein [unclassified Caballeronia]MCE4543842.1 hypothetical protein [Caballeronia sp. PC1]MCE4567101.1 hypothetical protein [Caballeronia sp. CLC5]
MNNDQLPFRLSRAVILGVVIVVAMFVWEGHQGFSLWDEGYLWYGVQRVMAGEVPIRDFQAYDPGRYYFSASLMTLTGSQGIMAVRTTVVVLQALALAAALGFLAAIDRKRADLPSILMFGLALVVWMVPRHKVFDISISIALICAFAFFLQRITHFRAFIAGLVLGVVAFFGRNHGVYGLLAGAGVFLYLAVRCESWRIWWMNALSFAAGIVVGYLPLIGMLLTVKGFAPAFIESIKFLFDIKATNLPLPVPWPWKVQASQLPLAEAARQILSGLFFLSTLVFGCASMLYVLIRKARGMPTAPPLFVACAFSAIPYAHYAFSRADPGHLAQGIFPTLIGMLAWAASRDALTRYSAAALLCAAGWIAMIGQHPGWQCGSSGVCQRVTIGDDHLLADPGTASDVALLRALDERFAGQGRSFFAAPFWPGAYALLGEKAPNWEIYTAWNRSDAFQREEIARLETARPGFAVIFDFPLDGRDELRYRNSHPLIDQYIRSNFIPVDGMTANPAYQIFRAKDAK